MQSKVGTLKLVKGLTYTPRTIVHQSVTNENFGNILSAIKLKYLSHCDNSKTKSLAYYHSKSDAHAKSHLPCKHSKSRYSALSSYQKYVLIMNTALLKMYPKAEQMMRVFRPWRSDQGPANKEYMQAGMAYGVSKRDRPIKKEDTGNAAASCNT